MPAKMAKAHFIPTPRGQVFAKVWTPQRAEKNPPIILLHDSLGCVTLWRDFTERLAQQTGRTVIAYDRLGFGASDPHPSALTPPDFITDEARGDFLAVLRHLEIEAFAVVGHSVGGGMGLGIAATYPAQCAALVTISAQTFAEAKTIDGVRAAKIAFAQPEQRARLRKYHGEKTDWILRAWIDNWLSRAFDGWSLDPQIKALSCPALAIHGENDEFGSTAHAQRIKDDAPTPVSLLLLKGEGHVPHKTSADLVLSEIAAFLAR
jgi:pimeloyl-ACP methyl ester carboxylesterase